MVPWLTHAATAAVVGPVGDTGSVASPTRRRFGDLGEPGASAMLPPGSATDLETEVWQLSISMLEFVNLSGLVSNSFFIVHFQLYPSTPCLTQSPRHRRLVSPARRCVGFRPTMIQYCTLPHPPRASPARALRPSLPNFGFWFVLPPFCIEVSQNGGLGCCRGEPTSAGSQAMAGKSRAPAAKDAGGSTPARRSRIRTSVP